MKKSLLIVVPIVVAVIAIVAWPAGGDDASAVATTISTGQEVIIQEHLEPGIRTLVEFTAEW